MNTTTHNADSLPRLVRRKELRRAGISFRKQDERMAAIRHHLDEAHGSLVIARNAAVLLREPCAEELSEAIDCVEAAWEQVVPPNDRSAATGAR